MVRKKHPGPMPYPKKGSINRIIYKLPLLLWRIGFGPILSHPARDGKKMMVVTTRGRKSNLPRHTMVSCIDFDQKHYAIAGWSQQADWVKNFLSDPLVTVQSEGRIYSAEARKVEDLIELRGVAQALFDSGGDSHFRNWLDSLDIEPNLNDLMRVRDQFYFVGFDPKKTRGPDALEADLLWIWAVIFSLLLGFLFFIW